MKEDGDGDGTGRDAWGCERGWASTMRSLLGSMCGRDRGCASATHAQVRGRYM
ncbi:hypothetical protein BD779DRAFT_1577014, partial [Infundibulicybe gibba]